MPAHPVEAWTDGRYVRAFDTEQGPAAWVVRHEPGRDVLDVRLHGARLPDWRARLGRALGLGVDLAPFHALAARLPAIREVAATVEGVRPPRFQALHEAFASVIPFQLVSLASAVATLRRLVVALAPPVEVDGVTAWPFPRAEVLAGAPEPLLREAGLSVAKARAIRGVCAEIAAGRLREAELAALPTPALVERLREVPGIGPWSAALLALRGFGRLDVFPPGDAAAVKALGGMVDGAALAERLGAWRGMLYFLLSLRRMLAEDEAGRGVA